MNTNYLIFLELFYEVIGCCVITDEKLIASYYKNRTSTNINKIRIGIHFDLFPSDIRQGSNIEINQISIFFPLQQIHDLLLSISINNGGRLVTF